MIFELFVLMGSVERNVSFQWLRRGIVRGVYPDTDPFIDFVDDPWLLGML